MTYSEIKNKDYQERVSQKERRETELLQELNSELGKSEYEIDNVSIDFECYDAAGKVSYDFKIGDFKQSDSAYWNHDESIEHLVDSIIKHIEYIQELRDAYPEYAASNDYIQSKRVFKKEGKAVINGYAHSFCLSVELCGYLKLPNTTSCSCGGGDYEIKRTPKRVEDFNNNIDSTIEFLLDCISELRESKLKP